MKEAMFYKDFGNSKVQCVLCPWKCIIPEGKRGKCRVRENKAGKLYSLVYGKPCAVAIDPIEKKPLFHFLPGSRIFSIGTVGCNLLCKFCQNYSISQVMPEDTPAITLEPEEIPEKAKENKCKSIAYTYSEPTIFYEYMLDSAILTKQKRLKNVAVTNGYINEEPLKKLLPHLDGFNVDLKGFNEKFYGEETGAMLEPVLKTLKLIRKARKWMELTNLIIPTKNDSVEMIKEMCNWIVKNLGKDTPLHFSRYFPYYKLHLHVTPEKMLIRAKEIAIQAGLHYVYIGNVYIQGSEDTKCYKCNKSVIKRVGYNIIENNMKKGKCSCGAKIAGIWK